MSILCHNFNQWTFEHFLDRGWYTKWTGQCESLLYEFVFVEGESLERVKGHTFWKNCQGWQMKPNVFLTERIDAPNTYQIDSEDSVIIRTRTLFKSNNHKNPRCLLYLKQWAFIVKAFSCVWSTLVIAIDLHLCTSENICSTSIAQIRWY